MKIPGSESSWERILLKMKVRYLSVNSPELIFGLRVKVSNVVSSVCKKLEIIRVN